VANKWLEALKAKNTPHNTEEDCAHEGGRVSQTGGEIGRTPKNILAKTAKTNGTPTRGVKKPRKKELTPEGEVAHYVKLAEEFPEYVHTAERAREVLEWVAGIPEVSLDIETYGRLKRDGLLYTRCRVRLLLLHHDGTSFFVDCDHVPDDLTREILLALKNKPKYLHNALFDIPRLNRRFGVLVDQNIHDTLIASRAARAGEWEIKKGRVTQISHSLDDILAREIGVEIPKDTRLKWGA